MQIRSVDAEQLQKELRVQLALVERFKQFHLSTKPMFFNRDSWNQTNDMLIMLELQAVDTLRVFNIMAKGQVFDGDETYRHPMVRKV